MFSSRARSILVAVALVINAPAAQATVATQSRRQEVTGGFATFFEQQGFPGSCGRVHQNSDFIVALPPGRYGSGVNCGRTVQVTSTSTGLTATGVVADECAACINANSLDLSTGMYEFFSPLDIGEFPIEWEFV
ncbi:RlpA-like double-psi beta-barrel-protein domain-containing protein-containing protein [Mycena alexandri]|uniref:RlpA-like double-psi beta-barrel-protein domain-containing protein-containing protein n=1 Tax=Mycena alexandri TaxID=1745969 RepID=A0AAD6SDZ4_9AGAR|nr:RlpA-like double-psi beta-barrel-protein domain-containing protein-containing protein [Mycena alexandri]